MTAAENDVLTTARAWIEAGREAALATVVSASGSAPRPVGSHLLVAGDGEFSGSVSGGCVEAEVVVEAQDVIATGRARMLDFGVSDDAAFRAGLSCGGRIGVFVRPLRREIVAALREICARGGAAALVGGLLSGEETVVGEDSPAEGPLAEAVAARLASRESGVEQAAGEPVFVSVFAPPPRLFMIGAVHIAQALAPMAELAGFEAVVIDPREGFASEARFPGARLVAQGPGEALAELGLCARDAVALLSHEPRIDDEALILALRANCAYVGALGSRKTHARRLERMRAACFAEGELARIRAPIGLDIGARTPAEIAVAILAEIIETLRGGARRERAAEPGRAA